MSWYQCQLLTELYSEVEWLPFKGPGTREDWGKFRLTNNTHTHTTSLCFLLLTVCYCSLRLSSSSHPPPSLSLVVQLTHLAWLQPSASPTTQHIVPHTLDPSYPDTTESVSEVSSFRNACKSGVLGVGKSLLFRVQVSSYRGSTLYKIINNPCQLLTIVRSELRNCCRFGKGTT